MKQIHVPAGTTIVKRGEPGDTFCVIEAGTCSVQGEDGQVFLLTLLCRCFCMNRDGHLSGLSRHIGYTVVELCMWNEKETTV